KVSVPPPAGNGAISVTGRSGHCCAAAMDGASVQAASANAAAPMMECFMMSPLSLGTAQDGHHGPSVVGPVGSCRRSLWVIRRFQSLCSAGIGVSGLLVE